MAEGAAATTRSATTRCSPCTWRSARAYASLFAIPLSGLWLVLVSDYAVAVHVAFHVAFFAAFAAHVGLVLEHQLVDRDRLLRRML